MKAIPYLLLVASAVVGYLGYPFWPIVILALASAFALFAPRRRQLKSQPQAPDQNMLLDGAYLLAVQLLIHFVAFAIGLFIARMMAG